MPRLSVEDTIREIETRQASMTPEQRRANLLASIDRMEAREKESKKKSDEVLARIDNETAERIRTSPYMDSETRIAQTRRLEDRGVYVFPNQRERAEATRELGIIAVDQGDGTKSLQDLRKTGRPGLMTPEEIVDAGDRLDRYHERMREIDRGGRSPTTRRVPPVKPTTKAQVEDPTLTMGLDPTTERQVKVVRAWVDKAPNVAEKQRRMKVLEKMAKNQFGRVSPIDENNINSLANKYKILLENKII